MLTISMMPENVFPAPIGICKYCSVSNDFSSTEIAMGKLALSLSILLTKMILGISNSDYFHTFSVSALTPEIALTIITAPSTALRQPCVLYKIYEAGIDDIDTVVVPVAEGRSG